MSFWGSFIARARVRRGRRALPGAIHGGVAVAAAWAALEAAGVRGTAEEVQRVGRWVQELVGAPREAEAKLELAGGDPARRAGGARHRR